MEIGIREESMDRLAEYAGVSIAFRVESVFAATPREGGGFDLAERPVAEPWMKDYDAEDDNHPTGWLADFDVSRWAVLVARSGGQRVGGAVLAFRTEGIHLLEGRDDLAVVWDLRVAPEVRGRGIGAALFAAAENWAHARGCVELKVETQDINVPACRFYERMGCELRFVHPNAYPDLPDETQYLWYKDLR